MKRKLLACENAQFLQSIYQRLVFVLLHLMDCGAANHFKDSGEFFLQNRLERFRFAAPITIFDVGTNIRQFAVGTVAIFQMMCGLGRESQIQ